MDKLLDEWFTHVEQTGKVRARTLHSYRTGADRYVRKHVGGKVLAKLTASDIVAMMMAMKEAGLGAVTIRRAREVLRNALSYAMMRDLIAMNLAKH